MNTNRLNLVYNIVLSSAKLQISDFSTKTKILLMNILNINGPNIEPCGIPWQISNHLLYEEPTCFFINLMSDGKIDNSEGCTKCIFY